jgi:uncharacterized protein (TIGR02453 family)
MAFTGFSKKTYEFLAGLIHNNERPWFEAHKADYETHVVAPAMALITDLDAVVRAISPHYRGIPKKIGGSLMRIYRDTRFSRDKTPYKTNVGIQLRHEAAGDVHAPGYYIHLSLEETFVGVGTWHPEPDDLKAIRQRIAAKAKDYSAGLESAAKQDMKPVGESVKRMPANFDAEHPLAEEIKRKDFLVSTDLSPDLYMGPELVTVLKAKFEASTPYIKFICAALNAPF